MLRAVANPLASGALPSNVTSASLNSITPAGGTLDVTGTVEIGGATAVLDVITVGTNDITAKISAGGPNTNLSLIAVGAQGGVSLDTNGTRRVFVKSTGVVNIAGLPTSSAGLSTGDLWNDSGSLKVA